MSNGKAVATTSTQVDFSNRSESGCINPLVIRRNAQLTYTDEMYYRLYPNVNANLQVSAGVIENPFVEDGQEPYSEFIVFDHADTAQLSKLPISTVAVALEVQYAYDNEGKPINGVRLRHIKDSNVIVADRSFTGVVKCDYEVSYRIFTYKPFVEELPGGGTKATYGTIAGYYKGCIVTLDVEPPDVQPSVFAERRALYTVYSVSVINSAGAWEAPEDWDTGGSWPDSGAPSKNDGEHLIDQRTHAIGYLRADGFTGVPDTIFHPNLQPQQNSTNWIPQYYCRISPQASFDNDKNFSSARRRVDLNELKLGIQAKYPGVKFL